MSKPLRAIATKLKPVRYSDEDTSKTDDELEFVSMHKAEKAADRAGNKDDVYDGSNVKPIDRKATRHGYSSGDDAKVYEEVEALDEITHEGAVRAASVWKNKGDYRRSQLYTKLASAIARGDRTTAAGFEAQLKALKEDSELEEKLSPSMGAGEYVKDFEKSKAPQFKGKSSEKKRKMAIAAFLSAKKNMKEERTEEKDEKGNVIRWKEEGGFGVGNLDEGILDKVRAMNYNRLASRTLKQADKHFDDTMDMDLDFASAKRIDRDEKWAQLRNKAKQRKNKATALRSGNDHNEEGEWKKSTKKEGRVTNLSDKVRRETEKMSESVDVTLLQLYINLDEENQAEMLKMIDEGQTDELKEFAQTITETLDADDN